MRLTCVLLGLAPWSTAWADLTVTYQQSGQDCAAPFQAVYLKGSLLRVDSEEGIAIYDGVEQTMTYAAHGDQQRYTMELDDDALDLQSDVGQATGHRIDKEMTRYNATMAEMQPKLAQQCKQMEAQGIACPKNSPTGMGKSGRIDTNAFLAQQQSMLASMDSEQLKKLGIDVDEITRQQSEAMAQVQAEQTAREAERSEVGQSAVAGVACTQIELHSGKRLIERRCEAAVPALDLQPREQTALSRAIHRMQRMAATMTPVIQRFTGEENAEPQTETLILQQECFKAGQKSGSVTARIARSPVSASMFDAAAPTPAGD